MAGSRPGKTRGSRSPSAPKSSRRQNLFGDSGASTVWSIDAHMRVPIAPVAAVLVLVLSSAALAGPSTPDAHMTPGSPRDVIQSAFAEADRVLNDPATQDKPMERLNAILEIVARVFAFRDAAELALGREWRARTPAEQDEFTHLFASLLERSFVLTLAMRARLEGGVQMRVLDDSVGARDATVRTEILSRSTNHIPITYRMIVHGDRWMIRDVVIDGISVVENYHAQVRRVLADSSYGEVVHRMRTKVSELSELVAVGPDTPSLKRLAPVAAVRDESRDERPTLVADVVTPTPPVVVIPAAPSPPSIPATNETRRPTETRAARDSRLDTKAATPQARPVRVVDNTKHASAAPTMRRPTPAPEARYWVQVGAFKDRATAQRLSTQLRDLKLPVLLADAREAGTLSRVRVGPYAARTEAVAMVRQLEAKGFRPFIVP